MAYLLDTHTLIWYLEGGARLSPKVRNLLDRDEEQFLLPTVVLAECRFLIERKKSPLTFSSLLESCEHDPRIQITPFDLDCVKLLSPSLEIFDAALVATALVFERRTGSAVTLLTKDREIQASGFVPTMW